MERKKSALCTGLALAVGVVPGVAGQGADASSDGSVLQLSERLGEARIESPLDGLEPATDLAALEDPLRDVLVAEDFEAFEWELQGWPQVSDARIVEDGDGRALRVAGPIEASLGWVLPVRSDAFYRFSRAARVDGEPFCDLYVVESRRELEESRIEPRLHFLAGRGEALKVHGLPLRSGEEVGPVWQRGSTSFYPTPRTRSLVVLVRPRVGADPRGNLGATDFDDVLLEEVVPNKRERMRLLAGAHAAPGANPRGGMRKAGWLLPLPSPEGGQSGEAAESNYTWREALYAPPETSLAFDLVVPEGGRLRLATGLARETPPGAAARFRVTLAVEGESEPALLLDRVRAARMEEWHWEEVDVDLAPWGGRAATLTLRTTAEKGDPHALWADPRIESAGTGDGPLVILIAVDTLRADRLSAYGYARPTSPALEGLAADGVLFDQARSNCNWTCPSFASIFTGLVPSRHGVSSYGPATPLPDELDTLAEYFQSRGWHTRSIAYKVPLFDGNYEQGFDQAFNVPRDVIRGEENVARALEWLESHRGGRTFLFLHFNDPHQPFVQPAPYDRVFDSSPDAASLRLPTGVPSGEREEDRARFSDLYDGAVAYVDACIGRFLDSLRERELYDRATIAFVADHGEELWERGSFGHGGTRLFDEVVRVPLIVKPPSGTFEPGRVVEAEVSAFDVMPTLLELSGIAPAAGLDARSLVPLITGAKRTLDRPVVIETSGAGMALVHGGFKLVLDLAGGPDALYDLKDDPHELRDVATERPDELARLRSLAISYLLEHRPGNYLLVHAGDEPARLEMSSHRVRALVGPRPAQRGSADRPRSELSLPAGSWGLLELHDNDPTRVLMVGLETKGSPTEFARWEPGTLPSLQEPGAWRVQGPEAAVVPDTSAAPVDAEMLEALKRLGYVE